MKYETHGRLTALAYAVTALSLGLAACGGANDESKSAPAAATPQSQKTTAASSPNAVAKSSVDTPQSSAPTDAPPTAGTQATTATPAPTAAANTIPPAPAPTTKAPTVKPTAAAGTCTINQVKSFGTYCSTPAMAVMSNGSSKVFENTKTGYQGSIKASCGLGFVTWSAATCAVAAAPAPAPAVVSAPSPTPSPTPAPAPAPAPAAVEAPAPAASAPSSAVQAVPAKALDMADIFAQIDPANTFASGKWLWSAECSGQAKGAISIPETGIHGPNLGGSLGTLRFGKVADPDAPTRKVLMFRANKNDPQLSGSPRCELGVSATQPGRLQIGKDFWFAFGVRLDKWVISPEEQILAQIHQADGSVALNPILALSVMGDKFNISLRQNTNSIIAKSSTTTVNAWSKSGLPTAGWTYFVIKAKISSDTNVKPYVQIWKDGIQIVDYKGPFGYNTPTIPPFAKIGHYQWGGSSNPWSATALTKTVLFRTPTFVNDKTGAVYSEPDVRAHVMNR